MSRRKKRSVKLIYAGPVDEVDPAHVYEESFGQLTPQQKLEETWKLVEQAWELKGRSKDELRLNRTVAVIKLP